MTTVATTKDFQERLYEKIRTDIGSLMSDVDIKKLVDTAMERVFFTPEVKKDQWGHQTSVKPPKIEQLIQELLEPALRKAISEWLNTHPDVLTQALDKALAGGLATATLRALDSMMQTQFTQLQYDVQEALRNALQR